MWGKGLYLSKSTSKGAKVCTSPLHDQAMVCTSSNLPQGLYDHVRQWCVPLQIYLKDCMTMWGKGLYLSKSI